MRQPPTHERMGITKTQRRRLWDYECGLCGQSLARESCSAIWAPRCTAEQMSARRQGCLRQLEQRHTKSDPEQQPED